MFEEIVGHKEVVKALRSSKLADKVGHAYLFAGPVGVGKESLARSFARGILCESGQVEGKCNCDSCRRFNSGSHPDFKLIGSKGDSIKIEQLRQLQYDAYLSPVLGRRKIYFFPEAEQLTEAAANSFLKLLEEAPVGIVFLFTAVRLDELLPTIRSRCQVYNLFPVTAREIQSGLERLGFSSEEARQRSLASHGLPGKALNYEAKPVAESDPSFIEIYNKDLLQLFKLADELEKKDRSEILDLLRKWQRQLRQEVLAGQAPYGEPQSLQMVAVLEKLGQAMEMCEHNVHLRLLLEDLFIFIKTV